MNNEYDINTTYCTNLNLNIMSLCLSLLQKLIKTEKIKQKTKNKNVLVPAANVNMPNIGRYISLGNITVKYYFSPPQCDNESIEGLCYDTVTMYCFYFFTSHFVVWLLRSLVTFTVWKRVVNISYFVLHRRKKRLEQHKSG